MSKGTILNIFLDLLKINSPSKHERKVRDYIVKRLSKAADRIRKDDAGKGFDGKCGNVVATFNGGRESAPPVILASHMDTVTDTSRLKVVSKGGVIRSDGSTILGADDKAGIAIMLAIAGKLRDPSFRKKVGKIEMLFTPAEEIGLLGATHLDFSLITGRIAYILDGSDPIGVVTTSSPTSVGITATIQGRTAHAGGEPEKGVNAIVLASKAISHMKLGRIDAETTANIGIINGGTATNIVPGSVTARGECRSFSEKKLEKQLQHMRKCFEDEARKGGGRAEVTVRKSFTTYSIGEDEPVVKYARAAAKKLKTEFKTIRSGGGSDANVLNQQRIKSVVVGLEYEGAHTEHEHIKAKSLDRGYKYVLSILEEIGKTKA